MIEMQRVRAVCLSNEVQLAIDGAREVPTDFRQVNPPAGGERKLNQKILGGLISDSQKTCGRLKRTPFQAQQEKKGANGFRTHGPSKRNLRIHLLSYARLRHSFLSQRILVSMKCFSKLCRLFKEWCPPIRNRHLLALQGPDPAANKCDVCSRLVRIQHISWSCMACSWSR
jgi:hypothetical protein